jgi:hypothetical protein
VDLALLIIYYLLLCFPLAAGLAVIWLIGVMLGRRLRANDVGLKYRLPLETEQTRETLTAKVLPRLKPFRYKLADGQETAKQDAAVVRFARAYTPMWALVLLLVLCLPLGLLLLLIKRTDEMKFEITERGNASEVTVAGRMGANVEEVLQETLDEIGERQFPAGWYAAGDQIERYWDGEAWTGQIREAANFSTSDPRLRTST